MPGPVPLTGQDLITKFENMVDDSLDATLELQLANDAKNEIEDELQLEITKGLVLVGTTTPGQTESTGIVLPANILNIEAVMLDRSQLSPVGANNSRIFSGSGIYWIDYLVSPWKLYLGGTQVGNEPVYLAGRFSTDDIDLDTAPTWPANFHRAIPYKMAKLFYAIDGGEKARAWNNEWDIEYGRVIRQMQSWDQDLKLQKINRNSEDIWPDDIFNGRRINTLE